MVTSMDPWAIGGPAALHHWAPTGATAVDGLAAAWPEALSDVQLATLRVVVADANGLPPLPLPELDEPVGHGSLAEEAVAFAGQFAVDVSLVDGPVRQPWYELWGPAVLDATIVVWAADYVPRARAALDVLFSRGVDFEPWPTVSLSMVPQAMPMMDEVIKEVAGLASLDAVTTELVRLRGARQHHCRLCMSRRSVAAMEDGADADTFEAVDHYRESDLTPAQQAALALTDAIIWTPSGLLAHDVDEVREHLSPEQAVEVVLDVTRNAANKIAVALGADAPEVDGVQLFEVDAEGQLIFP